MFERAHVRVCNACVCVEALQCYVKVGEGVREGVQQQLGCAIYIITDSLCTVRVKVCSLLIFQNLQLFGRKEAWGKAGTFEN